MCCCAMAATRTTKGAKVAKGGISHDPAPGEAYFKTKISKKTKIFFENAEEMGTKSIRPRQSDLKIAPGDEFHQTIYQ